MSHDQSNPLSNTLHRQLKALTVLHTVPQRLFVGGADLVHGEVQAFQRRLARPQGLGDRLGALWADLVVLEVETGQDRIQRQRLRDSLATLDAEIIPADVERGQHRVDLERLGQSPADRLCAFRTDVVVGQAASESQITVSEPC